MRALHGIDDQPPAPGAPHQAGPPRRPWERYGPPPGATAMAGWALLVLRGFLGFTFTFAGLQKLANPGFFTASDPGSIQAQLAAAARTSPLHALVAHLVHGAVALGVVIALGELAVGIATLVGLWNRVAAGGGMVISLMLFLTVSFHTSPYYTGSDIVFVFAWTPLVVAGGGGVLSVDAVLRNVAQRRAGLQPATVVPVPFEVVTRVCGAYDEGRCRARHGARCEPVPCPWLARVPVAAGPGGPGDIDRRTFALQGAAAATVAAVALTGAGFAAGIGRALAGDSGTSTTPTLTPPGTGPGGMGSSTTTSAPAPGSGTGPTSVPPSTVASEPPGRAIGAGRDVPVGGSAQFTDPTTGDPSLVVQPRAGSFVAFDAVCPHAGCIVAYSSTAERFICPCHGSEFNGRTGAVIQGPAQRGLGHIPVQEGPDGQLYVT
ncbi:MAG TPA: Rieske 2Fe-2S domain-containing protein [Acidimicrobiales bacterium]|nr:Rieske 2Fe-2S domain-containing protein [Acidimicrobiales bacterium]